MQKRVLLIEDQPGSLKELAQQLSARDLQVFEAFGLQKGLADADEYRPSLVVLELGAPKGDGMADLKRMAQYAKAHELPVVYVTSHVGEAYRQATRERGAVGYFEAPYELGYMLMMINMSLANVPGMANIPS